MPSVPSISTFNIRVSIYHQVKQKLLRLWCTFKQVLWTYFFLGHTCKWRIFSEWEVLSYLFVKLIQSNFLYRNSEFVGGDMIRYYLYTNDKCSQCFLDLDRLAHRNKNWIVCQMIAIYMTYASHSGFSLDFHFRLIYDGFWLEPVFMYLTKKVRDILLCARSCALYVYGCTNPNIYMKVNQIILCVIFKFVRILLNLCNHISETLKQSTIICRCTGALLKKVCIFIIYCEAFMGCTI
mgnify:CR=1 FL=1